MRVPRYQTFMMVVAMASFCMVSAAAAAKTITLNCPGGVADPWIYTIDFDAKMVSATWKGFVVMNQSPATITATNITFFYDADLGNSGVCRIRETIDRQSATIKSEPLDDRSACEHEYSSAQCTVAPDRSF